MAEDIMVFLGHSEADMRRKADQFKRHDEHTLRHYFAFFDNKPELVNFAKTQRAELEQILQSNNKDDKLAKIR